jgi:integrase
LTACQTRTMAAGILGALKAIIAHAQSVGHVAHNPALPVTLGMKSRDQRKIVVGRDIPSKEEINTMIDKAQGRYRPLLITAIFTGMRASEIRGLRWCDVDFDRRIISVHQRADEYQQIGMPKSAAGQRTIPMSPIVVNTLREWKLACPKGKLDLVFPNGIGNLEYHTNIMYRGFYKLQHDVGMLDEQGKPKYGLHALRHFAASHWIEQRILPKKIQSYLGHSSIKMTYDVYGHLLEAIDDDDHDKLAAAEIALLAGAPTRRSVL